MRSNNDFSDVSNHELLHSLWTKAVGSDDYDKSEWQELAARIEKLTEYEKRDNDRNRTIGH